MDALVILGVLAVLILGAAVYMNNAQHAAYAKIVTSLTSTLDSAVSAIKGTSAPASPAASPVSLTVNHAPVTLSTGGTAGAASAPAPIVPNTPVSPEEALALGQTAIQNVGYYTYFTSLAPAALSAWIVRFLTVAQAALASDTSGAAALVTYQGIVYKITDAAQAILIQLNNNSGTTFPTA